MRWPILVCCFTGVLGWVAGAAAADDGEEAFTTPPAVRRSGFSFGVTGGLMLASIGGYPNDVSKIDSAEFRADMDLGVSTGGALWLGGALTDWLSIGIGTLGGSPRGNGLEGSGGTFQVRVETFPLFYRQGAWQDLGVLFTAGVGGYTLERGGATVAEGEGTSAVGAGVFFEPWRFWQFSTGPQIEYGHQFSRSLSAHTVVIGWRAAFYGGP
jgi:hypothetical protein